MAGGGQELQLFYWHFVWVKPTKEGCAVEAHVRGEEDHYIEIEGIYLSIYLFVRRKRKQRTERENERRRSREREGREEQKGEKSNMGR